MRVFRTHNSLICVVLASVFVYASEEGDWVQYYQLMDMFNEEHLLVHTPYYVCLDSVCASVFLFEAVSVEVFLT